MSKEFHNYVLNFISIFNLEARFNNTSEYSIEKDVSIKTYNHTSYVNI
jgi:hypothetical protein